MKNWTPKTNSSILSVSDPERSKNCIMSLGDAKAIFSLLESCYSKRANLPSVTAMNSSFSGVAAVYRRASFLNSKRHL